MATLLLGELSSPEVGGLAADDRAIGLIALGAVEQHGPHLRSARGARRFSLMSLAGSQRWAGTRSTYPVGVALVS